MDPRDVLRCPGLAVVVLALGGCDLVLGLERPKFATICGTFGEPTEVTIDDQLADVGDLSFDRDHLRGMVRATREDRRGPTPVRYDADERAWRYDAEREANLRELQLMNNGIRFARSARDPDQMYASQPLAVDNKLHVFNYGFRMDRWILVDNFEVATTTQVTSFAGGELEIPASDMPDGPTTNYLPIFRASEDLSMRVAIVVRIATQTEWNAALANGAPITDLINDQHAPLSGAMARIDGSRILVYSARPAGQATGADLFIATQAPGEQFSRGEPLLGFNTDEEEVEPWITPDCSTITFRRVASGARTEDEGVLVGGTIYESSIDAAD